MQRLQESVDHGPSTGHACEGLQVVYTARRGYGLRHETIVTEYQDPNLVPVTPRSIGLQRLNADTYLSIRIKLRFRCSVGVPIHKHNTDFWKAHQQGWSRNDTNVHSSPSHSSHACVQKQPMLQEIINHYVVFGMQQVQKE